MSDPINPTENTTPATATTEASTDVQTLQQQNAALTATITSTAKAALSGLTDAQRTAVTAIAGDDPALQLRAVEALRPTWAAAPPKDTAPAPSSPKDVVSTTSNDPRTTWESLKNKNPVLAARFAIANGVFDQ